MIRVVLLLALTTQSVSGNECESGWKRNDNYCYSFRQHQLSWANAVAACQIEGSNLVQLDNDTMSTWIRYMALQENASINFWTAGTDQLTEGEWKWIPSRKDISRGAKWRSKQPDNDNGDEDCLEFGVNSAYKWNDVSCAVSRGYICERRL